MPRRAMAIWARRHCHPEQPEQLWGTVTPTPGLPSLGAASPSPDPLGDAAQSLCWGGVAVAGGGGRGRGRGVAGGGAGRGR
ncbi:UNVERIFIED_CONTAM: hypothetical protein Sradi_4103800 [Sesamum radiatum]|uniref:Uncharacterized protein n=1 Tax=Sesamum radiatum TaxID=300843 RepID=A0AAW2P242_SESRA